MLFQCGLDARFLLFAFWSTILTVAFFVVGYVATGFFVETYDPGLFGFIGLSAFLGLLIAMKSLPVTFLCALVGWCIGFALANAIWGRRYVAALTGAVFAGMTASFGLVVWMEGNFSMPRLDAVVAFALPTVVAATLAAVFIYHPRSEKLA